MNGSGSSVDRPLQLDLAVQQASKWLLKAQRPSGGWGQYPDSAPSVLNTAEVMSALIEVGAAEAGSAAIQRGKDFLIARQGADGAWCHETAGDHPDQHLSAPDVLRTALVVQALKKAGCGSGEEPIREATAWLLGAQNDRDGGWAYAATGQTSTVLPTCAALNALLGVEAADCEPCIARGFEFLYAAANADGSFGTDGHLLGPATVAAVLTIQRARALGRAVEVDREIGGLNWCLRHQDPAHRPVEEEVRPDPTEPLLDYPFLHLTETGLVTALGNASDPSYARSDLFAMALRRIGDLRAEDGGFFGPRVFSWSTARSATALWGARHQQAEIPPRPAETPPLPAGTARSSSRASGIIVGFAVLVAAAVVVLSILDAWSLGAGLVLVTLVILAMIAYRLLEPEQASRLLEAISSAVRPGRDGSA